MMENMLVHAYIRECLSFVALNTVHLNTVLLYEQNANISNEFS